MNANVQKLWYWSLHWLCRFGATLFFGIRVYGRDNVPPTGGVLLLSNHQSFLDPPLCGVGLNRQLCYVARDTLFKNSAFKWLIESVNAIAIKRDTADVAAMKIIIEKLKAGNAVVLFPEATRTHDGRIADIKPGFGLLSRRANVPVVPVLLDGAFECWPRTQNMFSPGRITVVYGKRITPEKIKSLGDEQFAKYLTSILRKMQNELRAKMKKRTYAY
jgi:1-acyl-sn-glycerol-3-phosphate acyltransferase